MKDELERMAQVMTPNEICRAFGLDPFSELKICEKVANAPSEGKIPSKVLEEEVKKRIYEGKFYFNSEEDFMKQHERIVKERKNDMKTFTQQYPDEIFHKLFDQNEKLVIDGAQFGPDDKVYLTIFGAKREIYPKDYTVSREVSFVRNFDIQEFAKTYREINGKSISGGKLNRLQKALAKWRRMLTPFSTKQYNGPAFNEIIFSGRATILLGDNDKTVVKCQNGETYDAEKALLTALFIREYGKNTYHDLMKLCQTKFDEAYREACESNTPKSKTKKKVVEKKTAARKKN